MSCMMLFTRWQLCCGAACPFRFSCNLYTVLAEGRRLLRYVGLIINSMSVVCLSVTLLQLQAVACCRREAARCFVSVSSYNFNSIIPRAQSFITRYFLPLRTIKCCSVVFGVTLRLLVIRLNTSSSSLVNNKRRRLPVTIVSSTCHGPCSCEYYTWPEA